MPTRLGKRSGVSADLRSTWNENESLNRFLVEGSSPSSERPRGGQRSRLLSSGGSETIITPPTAKRGAPHSAATAGAPKDRAVTSSSSPRRRWSRPSSSARAQITSTSSRSSRALSSLARNSVRRLLLSIRTTRLLDQHEARTNPGTPPPDPRSRTEFGALPNSDSKAWTNPRACSTCASIGIAPRNPSAADRERDSATHGFTLRCSSPIGSGPTNPPSISWTERSPHTAPVQFLPNASLHPQPQSPSHGQLSDQLPTSARELVLLRTREPRRRSLR